MGKILLGFEVNSGTPVHIPLHHTVITGMTQLAGKTTTIEALIYRSGLRAIVFKTKRGEKGFEAAGKNLPMFYEERGDWQYVSSLMEATLREKLKFERSWIIKITKDKYQTEHPLKEVYDRLTELLKSKKLRGIDEAIYTNLQAYLDIILPKLAKLSTTNTISIEQGVNVMDLEGIAESPEIQALIIRSVMEHILESESNVVVVVPECWKFLPQGKSTPVKVFFESFIRQGAAIGNFLWLDTQDLGGVDKTELRSVNNWILGRQRESNEVQRTLEQIPLPKNKKPSDLDIMNLKIGQFYAACGDEVKLVYVLPAGIPEDLGRRVAEGKASVDQVIKLLDELREKNQRKGDDGDLAYKAKAEELQKELSELRAKHEAIVLLQANTKEEYEQLQKENARLLQWSKKQEEQIKRNEDVLAGMRGFTQLVEGIVKETGIPLASATTNNRSSKVTGVALQGEEVLVTVEKPLEKTLSFKADGLRGQIMYVLIAERKSKPTTENEIVDLAREHGWILKHQSTVAQLGQLVAEGLLIKDATDPVSYRFPSKLKIEVTKS